MSGSRIQLRKAFAGTIEHYPTQGRPDTDAKLFVYLNANNVLDPTLDNVTITLDTVDTALTASSSKGEDTIALVSIAGIVHERRYRLVNQEGREQEVKVIGIDVPGLTVRFDQPLRFDCTLTTSSLRGHRLAFELSDTITATTRHRLRAHWRYTVKGKAYFGDSFFDVVLFPFGLSITEEDVELADTSFGEAIGGRESWKKNRQQAINDVWRYLASIQVAPDRVRERDVLRDAAVFRTLMYFHRKKEQERQQWYDLWTEALAQFKASKAWWDTDDDMIADLGGSTTQYFGDEAVTSHVHHGNLGRGDETQGMPPKYAKVG